MKSLFNSRIEAGEKLAQLLKPYHNQPNVLLLANGLGSIEVGLIVARSLELPLDIFLFHHLKHEGVVVGAVTTGGHQLLNQHEIRELGLGEDDIDQLIQQGRKALQQQESSLRGHQVDYNIKDHTVILLADGILSATSMALALQTLKLQHPKQLFVASPVAVDSALQRLEVADKCLVLEHVERLAHIDEAYTHNPAIDPSQAAGWLAMAREQKFHDFDLPEYI